MLERNGNMDKKETGCPMRKRIEEDNNELCERNGKIINNDKKSEEEEEARKIFKKIIETPNYFDHLSKLSPGEVRKDFETRLGKHFDSFPTLIQDTLVYLNFPANSEKTITTKPDWFDAEKFHKGQAFALQNITGLFLGQLYGLLCLLCHEDGLKTLTMTKKSHTPYLAFNRYMSTTDRIRNWYTDDPWKEGTKANKDIITVKRMHAAVRRKLCELDRDQIDEMSTLKNPYCPAFPIIQRDFNTSLPPNTMEYFLYNKTMTFPSRPKGLNQVEMSYTLFGFMGMCVLFPNEVGIYPNSDEDLENFCHVWRAIGYLLGVEDDANFCRGSLEDVRKRGHEYLHFIVKPAFQQLSPQWEHMSRCIIEGFGYFFPSVSFNATVMRVADFLNIEMPELYASLSYSDWLQYKLGKLFIRWGLRFATIRYFCNKILNNIVDKAVNVSKSKLEELQEKSRNSMLHVA